MHYFIIHSRKDFDKVENLLHNWSEGLGRFRCSVLSGTQQDWHDDARAKIRGAEKVIYFVGESSSNNENIDWELGVSIEEGKEIYVYRLDEQHSLNTILESSSKKCKEKSGDIEGEIVFSKYRNNIFVLNDEQLLGRLREDDGYMAACLETEGSDDIEIAMRQYEMFVETSEELVRRKQNVNSFYITINSLIISAILAAYALNGEITVFGYSIPVASIISWLFVLVGGVICFSWRSVLQSYADLNASKMKIISYIETQLAYNLYDTEWQLVSNKMGNKKYKSFSEKEMLISKLFLGVYVVLLFIGILFIFAKF